ncbi:MAG: 2,3-bisphosphoglycerate-independent phosphoglycerate mutase [Oscillospiraceae bacterium]|nr:2,3-bisphosphoglycerate-independent phosphoglycerate mutase [Oscillospiraceae bacterium]
MSKTPTTLIIMDGFGLRDESEGNAIANARKPFLTKVFSECPGCKLSASGLDVGLPEGQMGNSEVGHTNMGAGRVVFQDLPKITKAIQDGDFFENPAYKKAMLAAKEAGKAVHIYGLMSNGGVHSHITHIEAAVKMAHDLGCPKIFVHCFMDGRDVPPTSGKGFVEQMKKTCDQYGAQIATISGRYYAMDRDTNWDRIEKAYAAMVYGESAERFIGDPVGAMEASYAADVTDEFVIPVVTAENAQISEGDSIIFMNFRPDRAREITRTFVDPDFQGFERKKGFFKVNYVCTTSYDASMPNVEIAFPKESLNNIFGEYISQLGLTQLRIAETEKYAHVTFFFNGGVETVFPGEDRVLIPSPKVPTYDMKPDMSAREVAAEAVKRIESGEYDVIILNFANCDMVGHTGVYEAARLAVETVDECVSQVVEATQKMGGITLITADHGNADRMLEDDGKTPYTAHTTNLVPFYIVGANVKLRNGRLCDIAPTMLDLMGLQQPKEMTGETLIEN